MKRKSEFILILAAALLQLMLLFTHGIQEFIDTESFHVAADRLLQGELDEVRTPVYPAVIALAKTIWPAGTHEVVVGIQVLLFLVSVAYFFRTTQLLGFGQRLGIIVTAMYALYPSIQNKNLCILSESLAISGGVLFIYSLIQWLRERPSWPHTCCLGVGMVTLVMLRPSFLYLWVMLGVICVLLTVMKQWIRCVHLIGVLIVSGFIWGAYCKAIEQKTQLFTLSTVSLHNEEFIALNIGRLTSDNISDPEIREVVREWEAKGEREYIFDGPDLTQIPYIQVSQEIKALKNIDPWSWYRDVLLTNLRSSSKEAFVPLGSICILNFFQLYVGLLLMGIAGLIASLKKRKCPLAAIALGLMCLGNLGVNLLGSFAEWQRLFLPSVPAVWLLIGMCLKEIKNAIPTKEPRPHPSQQG